MRTSQRAASGWTRALTCDSSRPQTWALDDTDLSLRPHYWPSASTWHHGCGEWRTSVKSPAETMRQPESEWKRSSFFPPPLCSALSPLCGPEGSYSAGGMGFLVQPFKARLEIYLRETLCSDGTPGRSCVLSLLAIGAGGGELLPVKARRCLPSRWGLAFHCAQGGRRPRCGQP